MARQMKTAQQAGEKFARRVAGAGQDYKTGVQGATDWAANAQAAAPRRDAGLQQAIADGRINAGIARAGDAKWRAGALGKGVQNWGTATQQARPQYEQGMARALGYQQQAQQATASMDTTTRAGRIAKMAAYVALVAELAERDKVGR